jgi:hypothetical protein
MSQFCTLMRSPGVLEELLCVPDTFGFKLDLEFGSHPLDFRDWIAHETITSFDLTKQAFLVCA